MISVERVAERIIDTMRMRFDMKGPVATTVLRNEIIMALRDREQEVHQQYLGRIPKDAASIQVISETGSL